MAGFAFRFGISTIIIIFISKRYIQKMPSPLVAIAGGTGLYYIVTTQTGHSGNNLIIGNITAQWPDAMAFYLLLREIAQIYFFNLEISV